jgi:hypothetical protein
MSLSLILKGCLDFFRQHRLPAAEPLHFPSFDHQKKKKRLKQLGVKLPKTLYASVGTEKDNVDLGDVQRPEDLGDALTRRPWRRADQKTLATRWCKDQKTLATR